MRHAAAGFLIVLLVVAAWVTRGSVPPVPPYREMPIAEIAGKSQPRIGLVNPLPNWIPLPEEGLVTGAALYPPQPPYGPAAVVMLRYDETQAQFVVNYRHRLERAGFAMRRVPFVFHLIIDRPDAVYEADETKGGHVAYITLRHAWKGRFAQLTFYEPPAPRMHL